MLQIQCFLLRSTFYKYFSKVDLKAYCTFCFWASWNLLGQVDIWYHLPDEQVVEFLLIKNVEFAISTPVDPSLKNFDDIIIACDLQIGTPQSKILATPMPDLKKFLCLVIFLFNPSKSNAMLEPRTGHFWGLVLFKAKDLSFEGMAKNLSFEAIAGRPWGLHL